MSSEDSTAANKQQQQITSESSSALPPHINESPLIFSTTHPSEISTETSQTPSRIAQPISTENIATSLTGTEAAAAAAPISYPSPASNPLETSLVINTSSTSNSKKPSFKLNLAALNSLAQQQQQNFSQQSETDRSLHFAANDVSSELPESYSLLQQPHILQQQQEQQDQQKLADQSSQIQQSNMPPNNLAASFLKFVSPIRQSNSAVFGQQQLLLPSTVRADSEDDPTFHKSMSYNPFNGLIDSRELGMMDNEQRDISSYCSTQRSKVTTGSAGTTSSAKLFETIIRLDSEIKKIKNEGPLSFRKKGERKESAQHSESESTAQVPVTIVTTSANFNTATSTAESTNGTSRRTDLKKEIASLKSEVSKLKQFKVQALQANIIHDDLLKKQEAMTETNAELQELVERLTAQCNQRAEEFLHLQEQSTSNFDELQTMKFKNLELKKDIDYYHSLLLQKEAVIESMKKDSENIGSSQSLLNEQTGEDRSKHASELAQVLQSQVDELMEKNRRVESENVSLLDQISAIQSEIIAITSENRDLEKKLKETISLLDIKAAKVQNSQKQLEEKEKEIEKARQEINELINQQKQSKEKLKEFRVLKVGSEQESQFIKQDCILALRKNSFDHYILSLESQSDISMYFATQITDLVPSKTQTHGFQLGLQRNGKRSFYNYETQTREEMKDICRSIRKAITEVRTGQTEVLSTISSSKGSPPLKQNRSDQATSTSNSSNSKSFVSSLSTFFI